MEHFDSYISLVEKVESFLRAVCSKYGDLIRCRPGCFHCCLVDISVFKVEAENLRKGHELLCTAERKLINEKARHRHSLRKRGEAEECLLLIDGKCALYPYRPIICRTHGYPVYSSLIAEEGSQLSHCELNFAGFDLGGIDPACVINLNLLDSTLASINYVFTKGKNLKTYGGARSSMAEIFL